MTAPNFRNLNLHLAACNRCRFYALGAEEDVKGAMSRHLADTGHEMFIIYPDTDSMRDVILYLSIAIDTWMKKGLDSP